MKRVDRTTIHKRATADHAANACRVSFTDGIGRHTACTDGTVKPDMLHPPLNALTDERGCGFGRSRDHQPVDGSGNAHKIGIAGDSFDFSSTGIHGYRFMSR
jgi:hypothetical protein